MKTKRIILTELLILSALLLNAADFRRIDVLRYLVIYDYQFYEERNNPYSLRVEEMVLQIGSKSSKFCSPNKEYVDSVISQVKDLTPGLALAKVMPQLQGNKVHAYAKYYVYKNYPEEGTTIFCGTDRNVKNYMVTENTKFKWNISSEADSIIGGYKCQMATTQFAGRTYVAWFTLDIPISDGPYKFSGLPGLIVLLYDSDRNHVFILKSVQRLSNERDILFQEDDYIKTTAMGFVRALEASKADMIRTIESMSSSDESAKYRAIMRIQSQNNFIEIY